MIVLACIILSHTLISYVIAVPDVSDGSTMLAHEFWQLSEFRSFVLWHHHMR